jgi:hypothetical protein
LGRIAVQQQGEVEMSVPRFEQARGLVEEARKELPALKATFEEIKADEPVKAERIALEPPGIKLDPAGGVIQVGLGVPDPNSAPRNPVRGLIAIDEFFEPLEAHAEGREELPARFSYKVLGWLVALRGALNFCAFELFVRHGDPSGDPDRVDFPIALRQRHLHGFAAWVNKSRIPGLAVKRPDLIKLLESFQWFSNSTNDWFPDFAILTNKNKHKEHDPSRARLVRMVSIGNLAKLGADSEMVVMYNNGSSDGYISEFVMDGSGFMLFNADPTVPLCPSLSFSVRFDIVNQEVFPFLDRSLAGVSRIIEEIIKNA